MVSAWRRGRRSADERSAGVNVLALQRMLGHTAAKVTLDTYADLFDDDPDAASEHRKTIWLQQ